MLTNDDIDIAINTAYSQDMPADIKSTLFKEVVEVFTVPNVDRYALSGTLAANTGPNTYESVRGPIYVEGREGNFYKDRGQFYSNWPRTTSLDTSLTGDGATTSFSITLPAPVLQREMTIGIIVAGLGQSYKDDGDLGGTGTGIIQQIGTTVNSGSIVYKTGVLTLNFPTAPDSGTQITIWYYNYSASRPFAVMYWKDELVVRPVPDRAYKIEVEAYKYPVQFTQETDTPILKQWWQYIALIGAVKILEDRQDTESIENLVPLVDRQEKLIRNRMANDQIGQRNTTIYEGSIEGTNIPFFGNYF